MNQCFERNLLFCRLLLLEKGSEDVGALAQIFTDTCSALTYPLGEDHMLLFFSALALYHGFLFVSRKQKLLISEDRGIDCCGSDR